MPQELHSAWSDLIVAMLSVNNFPMTKTFSYIRELEEQGLFDLRKLAEWDVAEVDRRLRLAGYDRGDTLNRMFAARLCSLGQLGNGLQKHELVLRSGSRGELTSLLAPVKGIGPTVIDNFLLLRGPSAVTSP
jgi:hypothetical protein